MLLPIDARKAPFRVKYIDEETPAFARWMRFGTEPDGTVQVTNSDGDDIVIGLSCEAADRLVDARDRFVYSALVILNGD